jgi:hypothetical protein
VVGVIVSLGHRLGLGVKAAATHRLSGGRQHVDDAGGGGELGKLPRRLHSSDGGGSGGGGSVGGVALIAAYLGTVLLLLLLVLVLLRLRLRRRRVPKHMLTPAAAHQPLVLRARVKALVRRVG